jgi:hypothetical protein
MGAISEAEKNKLYKQVKTHLGFPARSLDELTDDVLGTMLEVAIEDYTSYVSNWLIEQKWGELQGLETEEANFISALTYKSLDFERSFAIAYGKQTGVGSLSPWELKKDFILTEEGVQTYTIPANREVNEVLWETPSLIGSAGHSFADSPFAASFTAGAMGWSYGGSPAQAILPAFSMLLGAQDRMQKRKILQSELTYKITGGPNGTKILHLYPVPGSNDEISGKGGKHTAGTKVWYWYYDTNATGRDKCLEENEDIVHTPDEVPLAHWNWDKMNHIAKTRIRKLATAKTSLWIGKVRGMFSGDLATANNQGIKMDYQMYLDDGREMEQGFYDELKESLEKLTNVKMMEDKASIAQNLNTVLQYNPTHSPIIMM